MCREAGDHADSVARDLEKAGLVANSFRAQQDGLLSAGRRILELDLTKDLAPSKETRRAEMFCNQCQGYVRVLAAPDHLKAYPEHTMRLRWYPPVDEGGEEKI